MSTPVPPAQQPKQEFPQYVQGKSSAVNLEGVNERLITFLARLGIVHQALWDCPAVVTSARDQLHGPHSKHFAGEAVDVRVSDVSSNQQDRLLAVVLVLCDAYKLTVFDERNLPGAGHFHVEIAG